jgi:uncharacterized membrane protein
VNCYQYLRITLTLTLTITLILTLTLTLTPTLTLTLTLQHVTHRFGTPLIQAIGCRWHEIHNWWSTDKVKVESRSNSVKANLESKSLTVQILTKAFIIDYKVLLILLLLDSTNSLDYLYILIKAL